MLSALLVCACGTPQPAISPAPIPVSVEGGLYALGGAPGTTPGRLLIDTGTVLTTLGEATQTPSIAQGALSLFDIASVRRADFVDVPILRAPLSGVGLGTDLITPSGILGGDLLSGFALGLDYRQPAITLTPSPDECSCQLADQCNAVFNFTLGGGGSVNLGEQVHAFPPTRVTLDACLEAVQDPVRARNPSTGALEPVACRVAGPDGKLIHAMGYEIDKPPGVDIRLLVATGFSGVLLGASAWDRLRGNGAAAALLAGPVVQLHFAGRGTGLRAARATLGDPAKCARGDDKTPCLALALVGREGLLGACGELARSRRLRWRAAYGGVDATDGPPDCKRDSTDCNNLDGCLRCIDRTLGTSVCGDPNRCNDANQPAAAVVELAGPIDVLVVDDTAPELQEVNADLRPLLSDAEGIVGTELLERLSVRVDYPRRRVIARCAEGQGGCTAYPRYACFQTVADCGPRAVDAERLCNAPDGIREGDPICKPAPNP